MSIHHLLRHIRIAALLGIVTAAVGGGVVYLGQRNADSPNSGATKSTGEALIHATFSLLDENGQTVNEKSFGNRPMLVYFGYTFCPDVCPTELQTISDALDILGDDAGRISPLFITIDPARDTVPVMRGYVANFHPAIRGLSGSAEQIRRAAHAFRVYFSRAGDSSGDDYLMDHSSFVYLMDTSGRYVAHFSPDTTPEEIAARIRRLLDETDQAEES